MSGPDTATRQGTEAPGQELPPVRIALSRAQVTDALEQAARRGRLPGYRGGVGPSLFCVSDFGTPFESVLHAAAEGRDGDLRLSWRLAMKTRLAWVFLIVLVATVWPGWWVTDSMLRTYFSGYDVATWKWYVPLTAPFVPWAMWTAIRRSRASAREEAAGLVEKVREALGGQVVR